MLSLSEIARGVGGAVRLMNGDRAGLVMLDRTRDGFWRSFGSALLLAPIYALYLLMTYAGATTVASDMRVTVVEAIGYAIEWTLFPVVLLELSRLTGRVPHYIGSVVALNWANVPLVIAAVALSAFARLVAPDLVGFVELAMLAVTAIAVVRILRHTLDLPWTPAVALGALNLWLVLLLTLLIKGMVGFKIATGA
jgi:hypothetical protein